jgi:hypothetical protein
LKCGGESYRGFSKTQTIRTTKLNIRVDGVVEFNAAMNELSEKFDLDVWKVKEMNAYNKEHGYDLYFQRHNPDGNGESLEKFSRTTCTLQSRKENGERYGS